MKLLGCGSDCWKTSNKTYFRHQQLNHCYDEARFAIPFSSAHSLLALISLRTYSIIIRASGVVLWMMWKMVVDTLCGRRRRIPRSLSFLLLFTAGGLLLFIKQKDLSEMVQQLYPPGQSPLSSYSVGRRPMRHLRIVQLAFLQLVI